MRLPPLVADVVERYLIAIDSHAPGLIQALYLTGSVALDDFRPGASDIDFLAVTTQRLDCLARTGLQRVHARVSAERRKPFFDGTYVTWSDLKADPAARRPSASVHEGRWNDHDLDSCDLVTWHTLAWHGVAVRGPEPRMVEVWTDRAALEISDRWHYVQVRRRALCPRGLSLALAFDHRRVPANPDGAGRTQRVSQSASAATGHTRLHGARDVGRARRSAVPFGGR